MVARTAYTGRRVLGMLDCLWGLLDGVNDAGLAVSLTFGGRPQVGEGFGIPLVIRYVLDAATAEQAVAALRRIPVHMSYNVTVLDTAGQRATVYLAPDQARDRDLAYSGCACQAASLEQPGGQRPAQERPLHLRADRREPGLGRVGVEQHREPVGVVVGAEVGQAGAPRRRRVQVVDGADAAFSGQWWYSPQLTSRHWPVIARARSDARNTTASAISSGSGSLPRSIGAAVSAYTCSAVTPRFFAR